MGLMQHDQKIKQRIIDYLLENPGATPSQIGDDLGLPLSTAKRRMRMMEESGEVTRKRFVMFSTNERQKRIGHSTYACYAAVTEAKLTERATTAKKTTPDESKPWRTTNTRFDDPNAKPYRNQGGQGTVGVMPRGCCVIIGE
jgi:DNA-binding Lrp family transcriptional regulator